MISTHTPARGVTGQGSGQYDRACNFYSHAREGRDFAESDISAEYICISTHTPARGVTSSSVAIIGVRTDFYSHAREGRDRAAISSNAIHMKFLLTRPRGA